MSPLLRVSLATQRRSVLGWGIGLAAVAAMYAAFYPSITKSAPDLNNYIQNMPDALKNLIGTDYASPAGYLRAEVFTILGPILFLVFAIGAGGKAIAGEQEARSLDLLLSTPMSRTRVVRDKAIAMLLEMVGIAAMLWAVIVVVGRPFDLVVPLQDVAAATLMLLLIGMAFGSFAFAVGCASGRKSTAYAIAGILAVATYIVNVLAPSVASVTWLRPVSPFRWYLEPDPLTSGVHAANVAVLLAITAVCTAAAFWSFRRRDLAA